MKYFLLTLSDKEYCSKNKKNIFISNWCHNYKQNPLWKNDNISFFEGANLSKYEREKKFYEIKELKEKLFPIFVDILNEHHSTSYSLRAWKIICEHWFDKAINVLESRISIVKSCINQNKIIGTYDTSSFYKYPKDSSEFNSFADNNQWNSSLITKILKLLIKNKKFFHSIQNENFKQKKILYKEEGFFIVIKNSLKKIFSYLYPLIQSDNRLFILNSYLPPIDEIKLNILFKQLPLRYFTPKYNLNVCADKDKRDYLQKRIRKKLLDKIEHENIDEIITLLLELIPITYLEGFKVLHDEVRNLYWPESPKQIFTANAFETNELFKLWTAQKIEKGSKYIIGQHGNNYGTHKYMKNSIEEKISDTFITWGWSGKLSQHKKGFIFNPINIKKRNFMKKNKLLLILTHIEPLTTLWDVTKDHVRYTDNQFRFIGILDAAIKENLIVRLHHEYVKTSWHDRERLLDFDSTLHIDEGKKPISSLINSSRIVVHSYDSTGVLQTLSSNYPTLLFCNEGLDHLLNNARPFYQLLIDAEILHLSTDSLANKVNSVWNDVNGWWSSEKIQTARRLFCNKYAKKSYSRASDLHRLMLEK